MQDKKKVVMVSVAVLLLLLAIVGTTYAYFTATVSGNSNNNNVVFTNGVMALEYIDGDQVALINAVPGDKVTKTFKVKNTGNVTTTYTIYMSELVNNFADKTDLVYTLTGTNGGKNVSETQVPDSSSAIASDVSIDAGVTQEYNLIITFKETNDVQDDNQGKKFSTKIQINEVSYPEKILSGNIVDSMSEMLLDSPANQQCGVSTGETADCTEKLPVLTNDDPDGNIRFSGVNPNNYIYFNCSDYSNPSNENCEKWRIVGKFNSVIKDDGEKENLIKIVRSESIGQYSWDYSSGGTYTNDWSNSELQQLLNTGAYYNGTTDVYYNYDYKSNPQINVDFTSNGLKNDTTRNSIQNVVWNLGTINFTTSYQEGYYNAPNVEGFFNSERSSEVDLNNSSVWTGKVGLLYPSDYGYATSGGSLEKRQECLTVPFTEWIHWTGWSGDVGITNRLFCAYNDWIAYPVSSDGREYVGKWSISTSNYHYYSDYRDKHAVLIGGSDIGSAVYEVEANYKQAVFPTLYLKSYISIVGGKGTYDNPYILDVDNK